MIRELKNRLFLHGSERKFKRNLLSKRPKNNILLTNHVGPITGLDRLMKSKTIHNFILDKIVHKRKNHRETLRAAHKTKEIKIEKWTRKENLQVNIIKI